LEEYINFEYRDCNHLGAMAGMVDLVQRVSTGIEAKNNVLRSNPELPQEIGRLDMRIRYRGHSLDLRLTHDSFTVRGKNRGAPPITLSINDRIEIFVSGTTCVFQLKKKSAKT
jgi:trehalose/maltose hydrolase-like predicted phosphorylase